MTAECLAEAVTRLASAADLDARAPGRLGVAADEEFLAPGRFSGVVAADVREFADSPALG